MKPKILIGIILLVLCLCMSGEAFAKEAEGTYDFEEYSQNILSNDESTRLWDELPKDTRETLNDIGIDGFSINNILNLSYEKVLSNVTSNISKASGKHFSVLLKIFASVLICALCTSAELTSSHQSLSKIISLVGVLCVCVIVVSPVMESMQTMVNAVKTASLFMISYIPIMAGIMLAMGQSFSAVSYNATMITLCGIISQIASKVLLPILNIFLSFSVVSGLSCEVKLKGLCDMIMKATKWGLAVIVTIFSSVLSLQNIVSASSDSISYKTLRLTFASFVPIVGSALGDALSTIHASVKVLKTGVGIFAIIATAVIFLPSLIDCLLWIITLNVSAFICDFLTLDKISSLILSVKNVLSVINAVMLCCMAMFIISSFLVLNIGGVS